MPRMLDIQIRVIPALRLRGSRKAVTPFEMASTPVKAVVPLAKACRIKKSEIGCSVWSISISGGFDDRPQAAGQVAEQTDTDGKRHHHEKEIGRDCESGPGFFDAAQVDQHHE